MKQILGPTIEAARKANPIVMARMRPPNVRHRRKPLALDKPPKVDDVPAPGPTEQQMLVASLSAFWELAKRWKLATVEACAVLAISARTRFRWRRKAPLADAMTLDRLQLILLTYQRLMELTHGSDDASARILRQRGSAENPEVSSQSLLEALTAPSVIALRRHYDRFASLIDAS
ncbi:MAG: hypothetical protein HY084_08030 [Gemmatimonadetes bacterium]|nr:hypothetical protein [Gemmatimonadota bacterium]